MHSSDLVWDLIQYSILFKGNLEIGCVLGREMWEMVFSVTASGKSRDMMVYLDFILCDVCVRFLQSPN